MNNMPVVALLHITIPFYNLSGVILPHITNLEYNMSVVKVFDSTNEQITCLLSHYFTLRMSELHI